MNFRVKKYVVITDESHRYTTTNVSGRVVSGYGQVSSTTDHHSVQNIWIKDIETGVDSRFDINDSSFPVLPGHNINFIYDVKSEELLVIVNDNTREYLPMLEADDYTSSSILRLILVFFWGVGFAAPFYRFFYYHFLGKKYATGGSMNSKIIGNNTSDSDVGLFLDLIKKAKKKEVFLPIKSLFILVVMFAALGVIGFNFSNSKFVLTIPLLLSFLYFVVGTVKNVSLSEAITQKQEELLTDIVNAARSYRM